MVCNKWSFSRNFKNELLIKKKKFPIAAITSSEEDNLIMLGFCTQMLTPLLSMSQWDKFDNYKANLDDEWLRN